jgi:lysylphosphatidylglycerol synthetase-like protein (DUF2156 family)
VRMHDEPAERPTGVTIAAALLVLTGVAGVVVRGQSADVEVLSAIWLIAHIASLVIAIGLWKLKRWAYWLFIAFVIGGVVVTIARLAMALSELGPGYHLLRIVIMGAWLAYFSRWQVRGAFAPPGSGYGR